ncbi:LysR substrate-binding domain-containing protein [Cupriavidus pauculus]|uniref:LysR substrate-binding domain-containing protein n=1 Tax=Cupriavidus pauculus TaxID=82633 RepID=UPI001EE18FB0|nr:LysR substrate-binding domain-containing protein [Cupriavidus pauculus]GJG92997.1 LysR family transcriptional regulator [Cupriavidus pauculus]
MRTLPPMSTLRAFEATARTGSVTRAAEELCRTHGAVSRQLRQLQEHAGVELFERDGTGVRLNDHGRAFHDVVRAVFDQLEQGYGRVLDQARGPTLHVACSATFAMRWLVPQLADFYRVRPDIRIRLSMTSAREMRTEGADVVIAWDLSSYPAADRQRAVRLAPVSFGPVCALAYARKATTGTRITHDFTSSAWDQWEARTGKRIAPNGGPTFPHTHLCIQAALAGLGVALVEQRLIQAEIDAGTLVAPYGFTAFEDNLMAVPADRQIHADIAAFTDWLRERLG